MKGSRFSEEQIIGVLREHEAGAKTEESAAATGSRARPFTSGKPSTAGSTYRKRAALSRWRMRTGG